MSTARKRKGTTGHAAMADTPDATLNLESLLRLATAPRTAVAYGTLWHEPQPHEWRWLDLVCLNKPTLLALLDRLERAEAAAGSAGGAMLIGTATFHALLDRIAALEAEGRALRTRLDAAEAVCREIDRWTGWVCDGEGRVPVIARNAVRQHTVYRAFCAWRAAATATPAGCEAAPLPSHRMGEVG